MVSKDLTRACGVNLRRSPAGIVGRHAQFVHLLWVGTNLVQISQRLGLVNHQGRGKLTRLGQDSRRNSARWNGLHSLAPPEVPPITTAPTTIEGGED